MVYYSLVFRLGLSQIKPIIISTFNWGFLFAQTLILVEIKVVQIVINWRSQNLPVFDNNCVLLVLTQNAIKITKVWVFFRHILDWIVFCGIIKFEIKSWILHLFAAIKVFLAKVYKIFILLLSNNGKSVVIWVKHVFLAQKHEILLNTFVYGQFFGVKFFIYPTNTFNILYFSVSFSLLDLFEMVDGAVIQLLLKQPPVFHILNVRHIGVLFELFFHQIINEIINSL